MNTYICVTFAIHDDTKFHTGVVVAVGDVAVHIDYRNMLVKYTGDKGMNVDRSPNHGKLRIIRSIAN